MLYFVSAIAVIVFYAFAIKSLREKPVERISDQAEAPVAEQVAVPPRIREVSIPQSWNKGLQEHSWWVSTVEYPRHDSELARKISLLLSNYRITSDPANESRPQTLVIENVKTKPVRDLLAAKRNDPLH